MVVERILCTPLFLLPNIKNEALQYICVALSGGFIKRPCYFPEAVFSRLFNSLQQNIPTFKSTKQVLSFFTSNTIYSEPSCLSVPSIQALPAAYRSTSGKKLSRGPELAVIRALAVELAKTDHNLSYTMPSSRRTGMPVTRLHRPRGVFRKKSE